MGKIRRVALKLELDWPYARHINVFAGTQRYAQDRGNWECVIDENVHESMQSHTGKRPLYDGIIARASSRLEEVLQRRRIPAVNVWYNSPVTSIPKVVPDFAAVGRLAAEHLLGLGLRRFACLSPSHERADAAEIAAFHAVLENAGCKCQCLRIPLHYSSRVNGWSQFQSAMQRWMPKWQPPLGIYVAFAGVTPRGVATECLRRGMRVPEDVALVAGHNEPILCLHPAPSLSSITVPYEEMGYQAARLLDQMMEGRRAPIAPILIPPVGVAARQSTNCLAVEDEIVAAALQYLVANNHREISIDDLAAQSHSSRRTLERRFASVLGRSIAAELRRLRIERAKRHLADPGIPIKTVAKMSGFANEQRLYEIFHRQEGISPARYRAERGIGRGR